MHSVPILRRFTTGGMVTSLTERATKKEKAVKGLGRLLIATLSLALLQREPVQAQEQLSIATEPPSAVPGKTSAPANQDTGWHFDLSPYLWFAGAHGTVGTLGRDIGIHATPGDLLSHFDIGLMGAGEVRRNRLLLDGDLVWVRVSDSRALPFPGLAAISADARLGQFIWTNKLGYRLIDSHKMKADANLGVRFWHLGQKLNFNPSPLGLNFKGSQNWADIIIGGRVQVPLGDKLNVDLLGDVGGWNATANLDYEFATLLDYKLSSRWTLLAGYRYLFVDYRAGRSSIYSVVTPGALLGITYRVK
jgi:hypothetical protein